MAIVSPKMSLTVWTDLSDPYDHDQLADNLLKLDRHDHSQGRGVQVPTGGIKDGAVTQPKLDPDLYAALTATGPEGFIMPSGAIINFAGASAPSGWLICDGAAVSRTTYATLFSAIGTTYGAGDGTSTFNVPNTQDRVILGSSGSRSRGSTGGSETVTLNSSQIPVHSHTGSVSGPTTTNNTSGYVVNGITPNYGFVGTSHSGWYVANYVQDQGPHAHSFSGSFTTDSAGSGNSHNNMQPYVALFQIIKV